MTIQICIAVCTELILGSKEAKTLRFTPLVPNPELTYYYYANLTGLSMDEIPVKISSGVLSVQPNREGRTILNTGTSFTLLTPMAYYPLCLALESRIFYPTGDGPSGGLDLCYDMTALNVGSLEQLGLPTITFHFENLDLQLPLENSYVPFSPDNESMIVCLAVQPSTLGLNIFENFQMQS